MATQTKSTTMDSMNYPEPDDADVLSDAQQLVNGALKLDNYRPIRELERFKSDGDQALQLTHFSTPYEKKIAESLQHNTNAWIDTAKDVLNVTINIAGFVSICAPAITTGVLMPDDITRAKEQAALVSETLRRMYNRSCDMAIQNSNDLLLAIDSNEKTSQNSIVTTAAEQHRNDLKKFQQGEVSVTVPHQSHAKLLESIKQTESNQESDVRRKGERSSRAWDIAMYLGTIVLAVGIIVGFAILKR